MLVLGMEAHSMVLDYSPLLWTSSMLVSYLLNTSVSYSQMVTSIFLSLHKSGSLICHRFFCEYAVYTKNVWVSFTKTSFQKSS